MNESNESVQSRPISRFLITGAAALALSVHCLGHVYPEHRRISLIGVRDLSVSRADLLNRLWTAARKGHEHRLSPTPVDMGLTDTSSTIDFASWPAIAGDHSCSPEELLATVLSSEWILEVNRIAEQLAHELDLAGPERFKRTNALRAADIDLLAADPQYATRAGSNNAHFLLPRIEPKKELRSYLSMCLREGMEINAIAVYVLYHHRAISKAMELRGNDPLSDGYPEVVRSMLADEAFALHFLQDAFAAGHVTGSWGDPSLRKGTHDYYNEQGLEVTSWNGETFVISGDAWMRETDALRAAETVRRSIEQLLDATSGGSGAKAGSAHIFPATDSFDVCRLDFVPAAADTAFLAVVQRTIEYTPIPGLGGEFGVLPRFNAELGPFVGLTSALSASWHRGGFLEYQNGVGFRWSVEIAARFGLGVEGVINESGDGLIYLDVGVARESPSSLNIAEAGDLDEFGAITAAIPARSTILGRLRMPFYLLPFDLLLAAPILGITAPETFTQMAVVAANGGLFGWQAGIATSVGRFQFIIGREVGVHFYGLNQDNDRVLAYPEGSAGELYLLDVKTIQLLFPLLEYRTFRHFSTDQSSSLHVQIYTGVDIPTSVEVVAPLSVETPTYRTVWSVGLRASLDWRFYF